MIENGTKLSKLFLMCVLLLLVELKSVYCVFHKTNTIADQQLIQSSPRQVSTKWSMEGRLTVCGPSL